MPDPGCSSLACCRFEPSLGSEGSNKLERPPLADFGGAVEGSNGAGRPISVGSRATIEGLDKARRPDSIGSEAAIEGLDGAGSFDSTGSRGASSPSYPMACCRKGPAYDKGRSSSPMTRSSHGMGDMEPSSSSFSSDEP